MSCLCALWFLDLIHAQVEVRVVELYRSLRGKFEGSSLLGLLQDIWQGVGWVRHETFNHAVLSFLAFSLPWRRSRHYLGLWVYSGRWRFAILVSGLASDLDELIRVFGFSRGVLVRSLVFCLVEDDEVGALC